MKKWFAKHKDFFLVVLSILVICLSLIILYDNFINKNSIKIENITNDKTQDVQVIDYVNYSIDKSKIKSDCVVHGMEVIRIPMLDSDKQGAIELNNKIKQDFKVYIEASKRSEEEALNSDMNYAMNYSYEKYKNYISIKMVGGYGPYCGTGMSYNYYYTYDVKNDKTLTSDELLNLVNLSKENLINKVKLDIQSKNYPNEQANEYINYAIDEINNNLYNIYMNSDEKLIIEIRYETFSLPLKYTYSISK